MIPIVELAHFLHDNLSVSTNTTQARKNLFAKNFMEAAKKMAKEGTLKESTPVANVFFGVNGSDILAVLKNQDVQKYLAENGYHIPEKIQALKKNVELAKEALKSKIEREKSGAAKISIPITIDSPILKAISGIMELQTFISEIDKIQKQITPGKHGDSAIIKRGIIESLGKCFVKKSSAESSFTSSRAAEIAAKSQHLATGDHAPDDKVSLAKKLVASEAMNTQNRMRLLTGAINTEKKEAEFKANKQIQEKKEKAQAKPTELQQKLDERRKKIDGGDKPNNASPSSTPPHGHGGPSHH